MGGKEDEGEKRRGKEDGRRQKIEEKKKDRKEGSEGRRRGGKREGDGLGGAESLQLPGPGPQSGHSQVGALSFPPPSTKGLTALVRVYRRAENQIGYLFDGVQWCWSDTAVARNIRSEAFRVYPKETKDRVEPVSCRSAVGDPPVFRLSCIARMRGRYIMVRHATPCLTTPKEGVVTIFHFPG